MGDTLSTAQAGAFLDELEKQSFAPLGLAAKGVRSAMKMMGRTAQGFTGNVGKTVHRFTHPIEGMRAGLSDMTPRAMFKGPAEEALRGLGGSQVREVAKQHASKVRGFLTNAQKNKVMLGPGKHFVTSKGTAKYTRNIPLKELLSGKFSGRQGFALRNELKNKTRYRMMMEELSRRGWTGQGRATKYLPVGQKGLTAGLAVPGVMNTIDAPEATRTGSGAALESGLGELGSVGGFVLGSGLGLVPGTAAFMAAAKGGSALGRVLDRYRAGAGVQEAIEAPTQEEASDQMQKIRKYYG